MKRALVAVVAVVIALLLVWFLWLRDRGDHKPAVAEGSGRSAKVEPTPKPADKPAQEAPKSMQAPRWMMDVDKVGTLVLEGQVVGPDGKGVAKAEVWLGSVPPRTATTEDDGSFTFDKLVGRTYALSAKNADLIGGPITHKLTAKSDPVVIKLAEAAAVQVTVIDENKKPMAGVEVRAGDSVESTATTDGKGEALLKPVAPGYARVEATVDGYAPGGAYTTVGSPGSTAKLTISMQRGFAISGRVLDESGKPIAKANVSLNNGAFSWRSTNAKDRKDPSASTTDEKGEFKLAAAASGTHVVFAVDGEHAPARSKPVTVDKRPVTGVEIVMKAGGVLAGTVVDGTDKPVAYATVRIAGAGDQMMQVAARQATTDENGTFEMRGISRTKMQARAESENAASKLVDFDLSDKAEHRDMKLVLDVTGLIAGKVVDDKGTPVAEVQVNAFPDILGGGTLDNFALAGMSSATTDGEGAFKLTGLPDGTYKLWAQRPNGNFGGWGIQNVSAKTGDKAVKITLASPGGIKGSLAIDGGGAPKVATAAVGWQPPTPAQDGKFEIKELDPGTYDVTFRGPDFAVMIKRDIKVEPGKVLDLGTVTVYRGRKISGRVVDGKGKAVSGATVKLGDMIMFADEEQKDNDDADNDLQSGIGGKQATSDGDGYFSLIGVSAKSTSIAADHPTAGRSAALTLPEGGDDPPPITLALRGFGSITGKVTQKGKPLSGVAVTQSAKGAGSQLSAAQTDDEGNFTMKKVPEGTVTLQAMQQKMMAMKSTSKTVVVTAGKEAKVVIDIPVGQVTLTVDIKPSAGAKLDAAQVFLFAGTVAPANGKQLTEAFLAGGAQGMKFWFGADKPPASFDELVPGEYSVCSIPITGDMNDPQFSMRIQENVATLKVYCRVTKVVAAPILQTVTQELPSMTPLPPPAN
jgi:Carboxypeptidase regulatory-like domain